MVARIRLWLAAIMLLAGLTYGLLVGFVRSVPKAEGPIYDGLGRQLHPAPLLASWGLWIDQWAGVRWHLFDMLVWLLVFGVAYLLAKGQLSDSHH